MRKSASAILATFLFSTFALTAFAADTANPSDVLNLKAVPMDKSVELTWDKSTDDIGVTGYKVFYGLTAVTKKGDKYDIQKDVKNILKYTVPGLENGKKYYFSIVAYDAAGNESINWATGLNGANQISATPVAGAKDGAKEDKDAPQVADAEALNNIEVKVVFSEEIVLPTEDPEDAFDVEDQDKFQPLLITEAKMDAEDKTNKTVILTTAKQTENVEYKLTVGIDVKDKAGNPMVSGTSDTAVFQGSGDEKPSADVTGPSVVKVETVDNTHVLVNFDETIVLTIDPSEDFEITVESDKSKKLSVLGVKLGTNSAGVEDASAIVTTSPQEKIKYVVKVVKLKDEAGNVVNSAKNSAIFEGVAAAKPDDDKDDDTTEDDLIAPKDVIDFLATKIAQAEKYAVKLTWKIPAENKDTKEQIVYKSTDKGKEYDKEAGLAPEKTEYEVKNLDPGEYWFKVTQKDEAGNESKGVVTKVMLSKTGPGLIGLVIFSLFAGRALTRRKK